MSDSLFSLAFDALEPGTEFRTRGRTITESDIVAFAGLTGDFHPQHVDREWAARGLFGERVAHGLLVLSFAAGLVPFDPERVVALRRLERVTFTAPTRIGDTISVQGRLVSTRAVDERVGLVGCDWGVVNQREEVLVRARVQVLWRRDPASPAAE